VNDTWDIEALKAGVSVTVVFAAPFLVIASILGSGDRQSSYALPLILVALLGFVIGAGVAAWRQTTGTPLMHGIATSGGTFLVIQGAFVIVNLIRGADVHWLSIFFTLTVTVIAGMIGGLLGINLHKRGLEPRK
jgi:putative membrane protein (TIGR04086 family)